MNRLGGRSRYTALVWLVLALPALDLARRYVFEQSLLMDLLQPSGEWSIRLMIAALLPGSLARLLNPGPILRTWLRLRRNIGVAVFGYAALHLAIYCADLGAFAIILDELKLAPIWTGWLAMLLLSVPAALSFDWAMRRLGTRWKMLQRIAYGAFAFAIVHWLLLGWEWLTILVQVAPLMAVWCLSLLRSTQIKGASRVHHS